jgi:hypothetical protein
LDQPRRTQSLCQLLVDPNSAASFTAIIMFGERMLPFMFIAPLLGDLFVDRGSTRGCGVR